MRRIVKRITEEWIDPGDEDQEILDASAEDDEQDADEVGDDSDEQDDAKEEVRPSRRRGRR